MPWRIPGQRTLDVAARSDNGVEQRTAQFANTGAGHRQLIKWLTQGTRRYIRNTPKVSAPLTMLLKAVLRAMPSAVRVSRGSITPSSQMRPVA